MSNQDPTYGPIPQIAEDGMARIEDGIGQALDLVEARLYLWAFRQREAQNEVGERQLDTQRDLLQGQQEQLKSEQRGPSQHPPQDNVTPPRQGPQNNASREPLLRNSDNLRPSLGGNYSQQLFDVAIAPDRTHVDVQTPAGPLEGFVIDGGIRNGRINVAVDPPDTPAGEYDIRAYPAESVFVKNTFGLPPREMEPGSLEYKTVHDMGPEAVSKYEALAAQSQSEKAEAGRSWTDATREGPPVTGPEGKPDPSKTYDLREEGQDAADSRGDRYNNVRDPGPRPAGSSPEQPTIAKGAFPRKSVKTPDVRHWAKSARAGQAARGGNSGQLTRRDDRVNIPQLPRKVGPRG